MNIFSRPALPQPQILNIDAALHLHAFIAYSESGRSWQGKTVVPHAFMQGNMEQTMQLYNNNKCNPLQYIMGTIPVGQQDGTLHIRFN